MCQMWRYIRNGVRYRPREAIAKAIFQLNLSSISSVSVQFDPFVPTNRSARQFLNVVKSNRIFQTNPKCSVDFSVTNDRCSPTVQCVFADGRKLYCDCAQLSLLDILNILLKFSSLGDKTDPEQVK
ncbi:39S ribosomal protein L53, mitochondrial [Trichuris trichiura]|uniref:Large ribosomal subunit protein mL53 n=1 Tax=Trichuris trichiura TaxID=36087 RepID=A0A077YWM7_TRITR|nr:39S ribosomal protein L53, mitochondrial [Trichuris trichiura]